MNCNHPDKFITQNKCDCLEYNIVLEGRLTLYIIFIIAVVKLRSVVVKRHSTLKNVNKNYQQNQLLFQIVSTKSTASDENSRKLPTGSCIINNNNNIFSRHLCHLRTISFMEMAAIFIAKFTFAFLIWNME